jgi:hypothetical protein
MRGVSTSDTPFSIDPAVKKQLLALLAKSGAR